MDCFLVYAFSLIDVLYFLAIFKLLRGLCELINKDIPMSKNRMNNLVFNLIYDSFFDSFTIAFFNRLSKNSVFSNHLAKVTSSIPPEYDDQVKKILCVLHEMKLRKIGDELDHIKHIITILHNELLPLKSLPVLYLKVIKEANIAERNDILSKCKDSSELLQIKNLLFPINHAINNTDLTTTRLGLIEEEDVVGTIGNNDNQWSETSV